MRSDGPRSFPSPRGGTSPISMMLRYSLSAGGRNIFLIAEISISETPLDFRSLFIFVADFVTSTPFPHMNKQTVRKMAKYTRGTVLFFFQKLYF